MDIKQVARLANLPLTDEEEKEYGPQLEKVLDYVKQLQNVDTTEVDETSQVTETKNIIREDKVETCPPLVQGYFKVKAIFADD